MNIFSVKADTPVGKFLRLPLKIIPKGSSVPILLTRAKGKKWIAGSGPHSCWLGFNEISKRRLFTKTVKPGQIVFDIGANVGSYTILGSVLVGEKGKVVVFEPVPENIKFLKGHIELNRLMNVEVVETAVTDYCVTAKFNAAADRVLGSISENGNITVTTTTLDKIVQEKGVSPDCIKIDVEGAEAAVLEGARRVLREFRPIVFVATHSPDVHRQCLEILNSEKYSVRTIANQKDELIALPVSERP